MTEGGMTETAPVAKNDNNEELDASKETMDDTEEFTFDMSMKKKKKKKKPTSTTTTATEESAAVALPVEEAATLPGEEESSFRTGAEGVNFAEADSSNAQSSSTEGPTWLNTDRDYTYHELLGRVFGILRQNNPDLAGDRRKFTIIPPIIGREGSKKTAFTNIADLCRRMRRPIEHVTSFLLTEMGTTGSMDANQRLIIKGRFQQLQVENLLRRYIGEYVTCKTCRSPETQLVKENRLFFMKCDSCGSSRSVAAIKTGFKAQIGRRIKAP